MNGKDTKNADVVVNHNHLASMPNGVMFCLWKTILVPLGIDDALCMPCKRCGLLDQYTNRMLSTHNTLPGQPVNAS